jgi:molybdenum cofactor cytidylyltransferase
MSTLTSDPVALVLAAGSSTRMGQDKLMTMLGRKRVIEHALRAYRKAQHVQDIVLIVPPGGRARYEPLRTPHLHVVENPDPGGGMITSIRVGLSCTWAHERNFLVAPADVPFVPPAIVDQLYTEFIARSCRIVIPTYRGLGGHPGLFAQDLREEFFLRGERQGTREILLRHAHETARLHTHEPDVCFDIDTLEDLEAALDPGARWAAVEAAVEAARGARRP